MDSTYTFLMCVNKLTPYVGEAIDSVLAQNDPDFEFIIVANNCDDALWHFLTGFKDPRIKLHRTVIGQLSFNLNYGLNLARPGYILRMDADDIALPTRLAITKNKLNETGYPDLLGAGAFIIDEAGKQTGVIGYSASDKALKFSLWWTNKIIHPACAFKVKSVLKLGGYCSGFLSEDYDLWLRAYRSQWFSFVCVKEPVIKYRINPGQAKGKALAYAEVAGHLLREALMQNSIKMLLGSLTACMKKYIKGKI